MDADLLDRVRKLLAKAEDEGCSPAEAEALTAKAAELMARYGIDRALLGALHPETDRPADRVFTLANPWGDVKRHLLAGLAMALRCQCVQTRSDRGDAAARLRLHLRPGAGGHPVHLAARADGQGAGQAGGARLRRRGAGRGGARGCSATARPWWRGSVPRRRRRSRRAGARRRGRRRTASRRRWCSPTGRWSCGGRSRPPTPGCARRASPTRAAATATGTARGRRRTSAVEATVPVGRGARPLTARGRQPRRMIPNDGGFLLPVTGSRWLEPALFYRVPGKITFCHT